MLVLGPKQGGRYRWQCNRETPTHPPTHTATHPTISALPSVQLWPRLLAFLMDREEITLQLQIFGSWLSLKICWRCLLETSRFCDPALQLAEVQRLRRTRPDMYAVLQRGNSLEIKNHSMYLMPPLAMDILNPRILQVDYDNTLACRFHHMTVVFWRIKEITHQWLLDRKCVQVWDGGN